MSQEISITTAGAGSGKTTRLTNLICEAVSKGECRPTGIIATTFTNAAAEELAERARRALFMAGKVEAAQRLDESLIGTVHSICARLLGRFAFEAGISPRVQVIEEHEAESLMSESVENTCDPDDVAEMERLARRLGQHGVMDGIPYWKSQVREIVSKARENGIAPERLEEMAEQSIRELLDLLSSETADNLEDALGKAMTNALAAIRDNGDATKTTQKVVDTLNEALRDLREDRLVWGRWWKLAKLEPAKASQALVEPVTRAAARVEEHPGLRQDLADYVRAVFSLARRAASEFQARKEERGALDFVDLEARALDLLGREDVARVIASDYDLLFVDEFQDTSPLQLALFLRLASLVSVRTAWVGDIKQAIYGFRGSDPELMNAAVDLVRRRGGGTPPLGTTYRARPELKEFFNKIFVPAFRQAHGFPDEEVSLDAVRQSNPELPVALEAWALSSGNLNRNGTPKAPTLAQAASAIAEGVSRLLASGLMIEDRAAKALRPMRQGDIAILCRQNDRAEDVASALVARGFAVTRETSGLLGTPEVTLALACLRRLVDPTDQLASAEIVALEGARSPEEWLEHRLEWIEAGHGDGEVWGAQGALISPALVAVERLRPRAVLLSPAEALDETLGAANVFGLVTTWGPTRGRVAQRRANIEALRGLVRKYEEIGQSADRPASTAGFILWCQQLAADGKDFLAVEEGADAIKVVTWHGAKGLEWPVVICNNLEEEPRPRIWDKPVVIQERALDASQPLSNRTLRFWPWPFGAQKANVPLRAKADSSEFGSWAAGVAEREELRLLYVGFTRARDVLILATSEGEPPSSLVGVPELKLPEAPTTDEDVVERDGLKWRRRRIVVPESVPPFDAEPSFRWFPAPTTRTVKPAAHCIPSQTAALANAKIGETIPLGGRLPVSGLKADQEESFGDAIHAVLAFAMLHPGNDGLEEATRRILDAYGVTTVADATRIADMAIRFRDRVTGVFGPGKIIVEEPFRFTFPQGQSIAGTIDLLVETDGGVVVIDHKAFPGSQTEQALRALSHSGQLALYREALENVGLAVASAWIHFAVGGQLIEVLLPKDVTNNEPAA